MPHIAMAIALFAAGLAGQAPSVNEDARAMAAFKVRVDEYVALHQKLEGSIPKLSKEATPEQIDRNQRALAGMIELARKGARQGDLFSPDMQRVVRGLMAQLFRRSDARASLRASIEDENPRGVKVTPNTRYPDNAPLATMPPEVLQNLPRLPEELEYRFVGNSLILLDPHAHLVVDLVTRVLPAR